MVLFLCSASDFGSGHRDRTLKGVEVIDQLILIFWVLFLLGFITLAMWLDHNSRKNAGQNLVEIPPKVSANGKEIAKSLREREELARLERKSRLYPGGRNMPGWHYRDPRKKM